MNFILSLLGMTDRVTKANERIATAQERIADMLEGVERTLAERLGYTPPAIEDRSETTVKKRSK